MTLSGRFFNPGPVEVDPEVAQAMLRPMIGHRGPEARELVGRLQPGLQALFGTTRPVMLATGSATAMMEAAIRSGVREKVLCVVGGIFGERFADVAERCDKEVVRLHVPRGGVLEPELLGKMLDGPPIDAVTMVHSETSTGALAPVEQLIATLRKLDDVVTIVDAVSSVGGMAIEVDGWGVDFLLTGSQKAIGIPPGLAFAVASERFVERARSMENRGFYLDVLDLLARRGGVAFSADAGAPNRLCARSAARSHWPRTRGLAPARSVAPASHHAGALSVEQCMGRAGHGRCGILAPVGRRSDTVTARSPSAPISLPRMSRARWQVRGGGWRSASKPTKNG